MPIRENNIALPAILISWIKSPKIFSTIVPSIQHETGFRDEHPAHGEIVLYATQLESISSRRSDKYDYPINTYGSDKVKNGLRNIFSNINSESIGKNIGGLRNEIAHVGRPKELLNALSLKDLVYLGQYLQIIIIAYILTNLGVSKEVIEDYQNKFTLND